MNEQEKIRKIMAELMAMAELKLNEMCRKEATDPSEWMKPREAQAMAGIRRHLGVEKMVEMGFEVRKNPEGKGGLVSRKSVEDYIRKEEESGVKKKDIRRPRMEGAVSATTAVRRLFCSQKELNKMMDDLRMSYIRRGEKGRFLTNEQLEMMRIYRQNLTGKLF